MGLKIACPLSCLTFVPPKEAIGIEKCHRAEFYINEACLLQPTFGFADRMISPSRRTAKLDKIKEDCVITSYSIHYTKLYELRVYNISVKETVLFRRYQ